MLATPPGLSLPLTLASRALEIQKSVAAAPTSTPVVDWGKWNATIKTPGVVDGFEKAFAGINVPQMEDTFSSEMDAKFASAVRAPWPVPPLSPRCGWRLGRP